MTNDNLNKNLNNEENGVVDVDKFADMQARDKDGNPIPAYPASKGAKKDQRKTSVVYTVLSVLLYIFAYLPIIIGSLVLAIKCYKLVPYYTFWPFVGVILAGILGLVFMTITLVVTRKNSKHSIRNQTTKVLIAFVCLSTGFGLILTYVFPDVISYATQNTIYCEDLYYNGEAQAEKNAGLERDFIMYNYLNGNLNQYNADGSIAENGDFSYNSLVKKDAGGINFANKDIQDSYKSYMSGYTDNNKNTAEFDSLYVEPLKANERKYELYEFIYSYYVLNDYTYNLYNTVERRAVALSVFDYIWSYSDYQSMLTEGFQNARLKALFDANFDSFNQDGYNTFDDSLLLYAQMSGRMTVPIVLRLILNEGWTYSQSSFKGVGDPQYNADGNVLYQLYDKELVDEYVANGGKFDYTGTLTDQNGDTIEVKYGFNEDGWMMFENGVTKRPLNWLVLDMLGDPMALTSLDLASMLGSYSGLVDTLLQSMPTLIEALGGLVVDDLGEVIEAASYGGNLTIGMCINDEGLLELNIYPMSATYGMLGFMQASWVQSDNLLMAVVNVVALRNWMVIFGAIGSVLVIGAGVLREIAEKTRKRTQDSRDRITTAKVSA